MMYKNLIRPLLFSYDPEKAHDITHRFGSEISKNQALLSVLSSLFETNKDRLSQQICGLHFPSPIGLAAGFDKNAHLVPLFQALDFGFTEIGSITANPSVGNPKPRLVRLPKDSALINRMGLNNDGAAVITQRIKSFKSGLHFPLGVNIAKTHDPSILGDLAVQDYITSFKLAQPVADYITVNISCPNTEEGKTFEDPESLTVLMEAINAVRDHTCPVFMKLSADLNASQIHELVQICERGLMDGYVVTNTSLVRSTLSEAGLRAATQFGRGGLSGEPLFKNMLQIVRQLHSIIGTNKPIIAVGGIDSAEKSLQVLQAGASLLQIYTGLVYNGPFLARRINMELNSYLVKNGIRNVSELRNEKPI
jgi:dihydroorotate dehydrogenase